MVILCVSRTPSSATSCKSLCTQLGHEELKYFVLSSWKQLLLLGWFQCLLMDASSNLIPWLNWNPALAELAARRSAAEAVLDRPGLLEMEQRSPQHRGRGLQEIMAKTSSVWKEPSYLRAGGRLHTFVNSIIMLGKEKSILAVLWGGRRESLTHCARTSSSLPGGRKSIRTPILPSEYSARHGSSCSVLAKSRVWALGRSNGRGSCSKAC